MPPKSISCWYVSPLYLIISVLHFFYCRNDPTVMSLLFPDKDCPNFMAMKLHHWKEIEGYVATTSDNCPNPIKYSKVDYNWHTGTTPLVVACQLGELDAVKRIVEFWGVDVCASAKYFFDLTCTTMPHHFIESATPLFVAALHGHEQIVRYLLEKEQTYPPRHPTKPT